MIFVRALTNAKSGSVRYVFLLENNTAIVYKTFGPGAPDKFASLKIWDLSGSSLEKTMSYWNTKDAYKVSAAELVGIHARVTQLLRQTFFAI